MAKRFSVIIPTLWKPEFFLDTLYKLDACNLVEEIIIISNALPPECQLPKKVILLQQEENVGVNPAWNLGVSVAKSNYITLLNDDFVTNWSILKEIRELLKDSNVGIVGLGVESKTKQVSLDRIEVRPNGFGCFMSFRRDVYSEIPKELVIYFGDDWLLYSSSKKGLINYAISGVNTNGILSASSRDFAHYVFPEKDAFENLIGNV